MADGGTSGKVPEPLWVSGTWGSEWLSLKYLEDYHPSWWTVLVVCAVAVYSAWYYLVVVNKPRLFGGGTTLRQHVLERCPILSQYYYPTFWAANRHFTTIARAKLQKCPGVTFDRYSFEHNLNGGGADFNSSLVLIKLRS